MSTIIEARRGSVILVDFQPDYAPLHNQDGLMYYNPLHKAIEYINKYQPDVTIFFNGSEAGMNDDVHSVAEHYIDHGLEEELLYDVNFKEKTYGFFRTWMDQGIDRGIIISVIRHMVVNRMTDSREIDMETFVKLVGEDDAEELYDDGIYFPQEISISDLKSLSGSLLGGGYRSECLSEIQLLMNAFNIKYKLVDEWIYGGHY